jgi:lysophospholipase L1-like esterase
MKGLYAKMREQYEVNDSTYPMQRWEQKWWKQRWDQKKKEANTPEAKQAKVVFIGDSITQDWEGKGKEHWAEHFAPLGALNWGFSGDRTEHVIWRMQNGDVQRVSPEAVVLMIGTNNTGHGLRPAEATAQGIQKILEDLAWKWPEAKVILTAIFPRGATPDDAMRKRNAEINALIKPMADGKRVFWQDINAEFLDEQGNLSKEIMPDLLHLNAESYAIWAKAVSAKLKELGVE